MVKSVSKTKAKSKKWYSIIAPKLFNEKKVAESYVANPEDLVGRTVEINMMELTRNPKTQNINLTFQVKSLNGEKAQSFVKGFKMQDGAVNRFVRKGRKRIDDSFLVKTKDGCRVRIKPLIVTHSKCAKSVRTALRNQTKERLKNFFNDNKYNKALDEILNFNLQKEMKDKLSKIYPLRNFEIRVLDLVDENVPEEESSEESETEEDTEESEDKEEGSKDEEESKSESKEEEPAEEDEAGDKEKEDSSSEEQSSEESSKKKEE